MTRTRASLISALAASLLGVLTPSIQAGNGCGCEAPPACAPVCYPRHCHHGRHAPPMGAVIQSAPVYAAPMMMAAPVYAAPAYAPAYAAPMAYAPPVAPAAPAQQYTLVPVPSAAPAAAPSCHSNEQLANALMQALGQRAPQGAPNSPQAALGSDCERRLDRLEDRVGELEAAVRDINEVLKQHQALLTNKK